ncbi:MAG: Fis family transcriptional regulator [Desulfuromonas sp.]|nr:MAG: Fis family transcriptional regulator [Desulfuromonas sp.]
MAHFRGIGNFDCISMMDSLPDGIFVVDQEMRISAFNTAAASLTGFKCEEVLGRYCHEVFCSDLCKEECPLLEAKEKHTTIHNRIMSIKRKDGKRIPITISASILYDSAGNFVGGVETIRSRRHINTIVNSVADGIFTVDRDMRIWTYNKAAEEMTGIPYSEAVGRPCQEIFHSSVCKNGCPVREAMETGQPVINREVQIIDNEGHCKPVSISASTLEDEDGNIVGAVESMRDLSMVYTLKEEIQKKYAFENMVSRNPTMRRLFEIVNDISSSEATVFIHGDSGTGKELFARAIHELSPRRVGPLIIINCGALPENLLEAEIFGVRKGAYTGADEDRPGRLELCQGGTFFLDEVGDLPLSLQVKLLRVLENREFQPVGGKETLQADVRFITATHRNLEQMVAQGTFRQDLLFRINTVTLNIPPLRERREDIPLLIDMAMQRFNALYNKRIKAVSPDLMRLILSYDFPGNVRELLNLMEQAVILCKGDEVGLEHVPENLFRNNLGECDNLPRANKAFNPGLLAEVLDRHRGNRIGAAEELGVSRTTLWRWVKQAGLENMK